MERFSTKTAEFGRYGTQYGTTMWAKNGRETARTKDLYGLHDGSWAWWTHPQTPEPSSSSYRSLVRAVFQPFLSEHVRYIAPTLKYLSTSIVAFPNVWILFLMATCQSQPFSTVPLIYREPLGSRSHFKVRGWHGWVDCSFFENFRTSKQNFYRKLLVMGRRSLRHSIEPRLASRFKNFWKFGTQIC